MGAALERVDVDGPKAFAYWQKWCWGTEDMPVGFIMSTGQGELSQASVAFRYVLSRLGLAKLRSNTPLGKAYEAPFPSPEYKMGPRAMPRQVPMLPDDPSVKAQRKAWAFYNKFEKPFLCAFTDNDPVTRGSDALFLENVPGAKGMPHETIRGGGHFVQEQQPKKLVKLITDLIRSAE
jgi:haloalkane dehalogenase